TARERYSRLVRQENGLDIRATPAGKFDHERNQPAMMTTDTGVVMSSGIGRNAILPVGTFRCVTKSVTS
ncbi:MAG: hypothetical protein ACERKU_08590, partial [Nitrospirota bacterium]